MRKQLTIAAIVTATLGTVLGTGAWATPDINQTITATEENVNEIIAGTLAINESNISCDGQPDGEVVTQSTGVATLSQEATVLITGEGACLNLQVPNTTTYQAQATLQDKYWGWNSTARKWMYLNSPGGCSAVGGLHGSTEGAWAQPTLDSLCTFPEFIWNGTSYVQNPALNTLHEVVWTVTFPGHERPTYSIPSHTYFLNG